MIDITLLPDSWLTELALLALAFVLSVAIGVERSRRLLQRSRRNALPRQRRRLHVDPQVA